MSADNVAALVAAITSGTASLVLVGVVVALGRRVRELGKTVDELRHETLPLVHDARVVVDQAATEMVRVGDVLDSAEAVSSTVDSASRLAYRAFSNPVVKILAYSTGVGSALRRFFGRPPKVDARTAAARYGRARPDAPRLADAATEKATEKQRDEAHGGSNRGRRRRRHAEVPR